MQLSSVSGRLGRLPLVLLLFVGAMLAGEPALAQQRRSSPRPAAPDSGPSVAPDATTGPTIGVTLQDREKSGRIRAEVVAVEPGSPAAAAGFLPGDRLLAVAGTRVTLMAEARARIQVELAKVPAGSGRTLLIQVARDRKRVNLQVRIPAAARNSTTTRQSVREQRRFLTTGGGAATLTHGEVTDPLVIPGLAPRPVSATGINVLRRVFIDLRTGQLAFVGYYDPAYATGPIDYSTLLADALHSPRPSFSLEATPESKAAAAAFVRQFDQQMQRNLGSVEAGKAWLTGIFDQLLTNPALEVDRRRFLARGAEIFGVQPAEVPPFVQAMLGRTEMGSPPWVDFWARFYQHAGAPEAAAYIRAAANKDNDNDAFQASLDGLGLRPTITELRAALQSGALSQPVVYARLEVAIWAAIYRRCGVPDSRWRPAGDRAGQTGDTTPWRAVIDAINAEMVTEKVMDPWLNGLVLSERFLQVMNQMPPLSVAPVCSDGLASDSELARTFLAADWTLKNLGVTPELAQKVPGHRTPSQYSFALETARHVYDLGDVNARMWLQPSGVDLRHDPTGSTVDFGRSNIAIHASVIAHGRTGSAAAKQLARDAVDSYASELTRRYDEYARALPDLHRLREAGKVIALAQWAGARGLRLTPPVPPVRPGPMPDNFQRGFWTGNFYANPEKTFFGLVAIGGVDFGPEVGSGWVQSSVDPALESSALGQLAASEALGRQAVAAAQQGDLDSARALAEQSARAMTGDFDPRSLPSLAVVPDVPPPEPVLQAQLQSELIAETRQAVEALTQAQQSLRQAGDSPALRAEAESRQAQAQDRLQKLAPIVDARPTEPAQVRHWMTLLRQGQSTGFATPAAQPPPVATQTPIAESPLAPAPAQPSALLAAPKPAVDPAERALMRDELTVLRSELCRVQRQLRRFNASIQADQAQRDEWEKVSNDAYESALEHVKEELRDLSMDFPQELLNERIKQLSDPAAKARLERGLRLVQRLKESYATKDFAGWAAHPEYGRAEVIEGIGIITDILEVEDKVKDFLAKRWGLGRVFAYQEAASDLITSAYDVTAEVVAWRRLQQLNRNSEDFLRAVESAGRRQREVMEAIHAREIRLGLDPGSSREPCPP